MVVVAVVVGDFGVVLFVLVGYFGNGKVVRLVVLIVPVEIIESIVSDFTELETISILVVEPLATTSFTT